MNKARRIVFAVMVVFVFAAATGCAQKLTKSGFMKNYPKFKEGPSGGADWVYIKKGADFKKYHKIMMDPVVFFWKKDADYKGIQPEVLKELADAFHKAMLETLQVNYPFVDKPGPDVLRVQVAITDVVPSRPVLNTITTLMPIGLGISIIKSGITGAGSFVGEASMEVELRDSLTNDRIGAAIDWRPAPKYKFIKGMQKWEQTKDSFILWAERMKKFMYESHGIKKK